MRRLAFAGAVIFAGLTLAACGESVSPATEEAAIAEQNKKWLEAIAAKDAATVVQIYAEDGGMYAPNAPRTVGHEALQKAWSEFLAAPGLQLTFATEKVVLSKSGDVAIDIGNYDMSMGDGATKMTDKGKSVVTWVKRDGKWLVLTDMFSSDAPPAPPPAATSAAPPAPDAGQPAAAPGTETAPAAPGATPAPPATTPAPTTPAPTNP